MKKKNIVILILSIIIVIMAIVIILLLFNKNIITDTASSTTYSIDGSKMSNSKLLEMFEKEGYEIKIECFSNSKSTMYVILDNKTEGITIQRIYNIYIGNQLTFSDDSINDSIADLLYTNENDTNDKKQQYKAYQSWLEKYNITKTQLSEMLDTYYNQNPDKIEVIDIDNLLYK